MNVSMPHPAQSSLHGAMQGHKPNNEQLAQHMAKAVSNGDISTEQLQKHLSERFGVDKAAPITTESGGIDVDILAKTLKDSQTEETAHRPPPPRTPLSSSASGKPTESPSIEKFLGRVLGEDQLHKMSGEDGSMDIDAMVSLVRDRLSAEGANERGNIIDLQA